MYTNWQEQGLDSFTAIRWYRVGAVVEYLHELRRYIICTPGKLSSTYMPMLQKEYSQVYDGEQDALSEGHAMAQQNNERTQGLPAKESQRFPAHEVYICEAIGDWGLMLDRLALMSSIMVNTNRLERRYPHVDTAGGLEEQGMVMIHKLMRMIVERVDFVNRQQFEARYDLNWQQEQEHEQTSQQRSGITESNKANHVKREETPRRDTTGSGSSTPHYRSMSSDRSEGTVDLTSNQPN
ncbi:uncharacterized protein ATC70_012769 [Mucor velutinosus]|uniref:Uncharacterized protein n=1 Tax=Mucor velutinosus TaxID=708070 RepID=A0AAN7D6S9_9FUNG|nr:hypothetical protein ATC70_012769 [Mucor velutinosus]